MNPEAFPAGSDHTLLTLQAGHDGYCSDKWEAILRKYDALFPLWRNRAVRLLEIGVQNGGSLEVWAKYFPQAVCIVGCDITPACGGLRFADSRIQVVVGDAASGETLAALAEKSPEFDLIIDDGSHVSSDVIRTFCQLFPRLADGGVYVVEDLHCSYWAEYGGGLFAPHSAMAFFKVLCDVVNFDHWGFPAAPDLVLSGVLKDSAGPLDPQILRHVHAVEFVNSLCVIHKRSPEENALGPRAVGGRVAEVNAACLKETHNDCQALDQSLARWSCPSCAPAQVAADLAEAVGKPREMAVSVPEFQEHLLHQEIVPLRERVEILQKEKAALQGDLTTLLAEFFAVKNSLSWRATAPLRRVRRFLLRIFGRSSDSSP